LYRTFFCELDDFDQPFAARFPDVQAQLPRETYSSKDDNQFKPGQPTDTAEASMRNGGYACIAQAAWLLDQVFKAIELTDIDAKLIQLGGLDSTLRTFLTIVMEQSKGKWGKFCTANAILIRLVFQVVDLDIIILTRSELGLFSLYTGKFSTKYNICHIVDISLLKNGTRHPPLH
jgi:hypothetical protein